MFHAKETPTGLVNGVNMIFNTANLISQIDDVFVDGEVYLGTVTISGTQITLADAPSYEIKVDYWDASPAGAMPAAGIRKTVTAFRTALMNEYGLDEDNDNEGTSADAILEYINDASAFFINYRAWIFRLKKKTFKIYPDTTVDTAFTTLGPTIDLAASTTWPLTGAVMIDYDIIQYTNNVGSVLTPVLTDIDRDHDASDRALLMYEVPSDYNKMASLFVGSTQYRREDLRLGTEPSSRHFWEESILLADGTTRKFLIFPYHTSTQKVYMTYGKAAADLTATDPANTYIEVPHPYWNYLKEAVFARIDRHLEEFNSAQLHENNAALMLKKAAIFDSKQHFGIRVPIQSEWDNPQAKLGIGSFNANRFHRNN